MTPRRTRFSRIYRRLTRRTPDRKAQWKQISNLRSHSSLGHRTVEIRRHVYLTSERVIDLSPVVRDRSEFVEERVPVKHEREPASAGGVAVAALTASLFLLACAYAAFTGYAHSYDDGFAYLGILGAVGSLLAAGIGICLAASNFRRRYSGRLLSACAISLAALYGVLLFFASGR